MNDFPLDISCDELQPTNSEEKSLEGSTVTLSYHVPKLSSSDYFFWYQQRPGEPPQVLISHSASGKVGNEVPGLKIRVDGSQIQLEISSAALTHSAVYYCAVRPTVRGSPPSLYKNLTALH